jgi:S1-C subfamily serine protease
MLLESFGIRLRLALRFPGLRVIDGVLGAVLTACVGLGIVWIVGAVSLAAVSLPGLRHDLAHSAILRDLDKALPPSGGILNALSRIDPLPSLSGPSAEVPRPTKGILAKPAVRAAFPSVVRVVGTACGLGIEGSGWVAGPDTVVTNAHVVAGENDTSVQVGGSGPALPVRVVLFDPTNDVAVLRVHLSEHALPIAAGAPSGTAVGILGYPQDGPFKAVPGRIGITKPVLTDNAYGDGPVLRTITALRGLVKPGNSGGPLVDSAGRVVAMAFAEITNSAPGTGPGGFAVPADVIRSELAKAAGKHAAQSTQGCAA